MTVVAVLVLGRWDEAEFAVESLVVEPVDVFEGGELDVVEAAPGALMADSAMALSNESPLEPTEATAPAWARRSV